MAFNLQEFSIISLPLPGGDREPPPPPPPRPFNKARRGPTRKHPPIHDFVRKISALPLKNPGYTTDTTVTGVVHEGAQGAMPPPPSVHLRVNKM